jgi:hypothetical protein
MSARIGAFLVGRVDSLYVRVDFWRVESSPFELKSAVGAVYRSRLDCRIV